MKEQKSPDMDKKVLNDFRKDLENIIKEFIENNGIEIFGNLNIEIANIDNPALIKGNTIYVDINARRYPKYILKYVVAHELAHLIIKRHTKKFWEIVKQIYPQYEKGRDRLTKILARAENF